MSAGTIGRCPTCGTPDLEDSPLALVVYFATEEDRAEFVEAFKEVKPNARAIPIDRISGH